MHQMRATEGDINCVSKSTLRVEIALASTLVIACATPPSDCRKNLLAFLTPYATTQTEIVQALGQPDSRYDVDGIIVYRLESRDCGYYRSTRSAYREKYNLVLAIDARDLLVRYRLVPITDVEEE